MFEWYEAEVRALEEKCASAPPPEGAVAFYGSSSIRLWSTLSEDFPDVSVVNLGFGGSTLAACAYFFERIVLPLRPRVLICYAGENDLGDGVLPDAILASFRGLHSKVQDHLGEAPFGYLAIKPSPARWHHIERIREVNRRIQSEVAARPTSHYIDVHTPMLRDDGSPRRELWTADGIHINADGYRIWWQVISAQRRLLGF